MPCITHKVWPAVKVIVALSCCLSQGELVIASKVLTSVVLIIVDLQGAQPMGYITCI